MRNVWLRSPNPSNANNVRIVNTDGSVNNNNANNSHGVAADCEKLSVSSSRKTKAVQLTQGATVLPPKKKEGILRVTAVSFEIVRLSALAIIFIMSYEKIIAFDSLYKGLKKCCKNVRWKDSTVGYEGNALKNTYRLRQSLVNGKYKLDKYQRFIIHEPKRREIVATRIKDRQFQRSLCDNGFYEEITRSFIADNCACLQGRGVDYTLNRTTAHLRRYYAENGREGWVLKCDIYHYFQSINHDVAKAAIHKRVKDAQIAERACEIVDSFGEIGLGLGSQVSQLVALAVLDDIDHYIKERLHIKHYIRYMDDFVLIHTDKAYLQECLGQITEKLNAIGLQLNKKTALYPLRQGVKLLQWRFTISDSGRIVRKMDKKKQGKQRRKLKKLYAKEQNGDYAPRTAHESLVSWLANAARGDTYHQRRKMIKFYKELEDSYNEKRPLQTPCESGGNGE